MLRDCEVLTAMVGEIAGEAVASANAGEKAKVLKAIIRNHLEGAEGRQKRDGWVPRWMAFPPSAYTTRGGVGTVDQAERAAAATRPVEEHRGDEDQTSSMEQAA